MGLNNRDYYKEKIEKIEKNKKLAEKRRQIFIQVIVFILIAGLVLSSFIF